MNPRSASPIGAARHWWLLMCVSFLAGTATAAAEPDLREAFLRPPDSARPWVYWFWLNGNMSREGITADLEAMKRVGIGGVLIMEVDQGAPLGPAGFMSPQWRELFKHVVAEARRLGLEVNMNNDAGWNGSGGPWIKPEQSMQKVVWTETVVDRPGRYEGNLPQPEAVAGFYQDIAVLAVPTVGDYRIPNIRVKAAFETGYPGGAAYGKVPEGTLIDRERTQDISARMDGQGRVAWDVPQGKWTLIRFGRTSTGVTNAPSPKSGQGLECDKLSKEGIEANFNGMMAKLIADVGRDAGGALAATHIDSWENGSQNWTARMREEFRRRRGYDLFPFLPVMTGRVVQSLEISERFLWDLRRTISELVVENYAVHMRELAAAGGLRFTVEAYGSPCDHLPYAGASDEPMGEFWIGGGAIESCRGMASAAHVYGKTIVGAEAFTAADQERWREHPASIKALGDRAFCEGINRFVFHRYAMQPWKEDRRPGMTMGPWGLHYERTQTWWEQSTAWHEYLARCQYMLRQGLFVADICYLQAESPPQGYSLHTRQGYDWDECPVEVVLTRMSVKDGRIVLPDGMSYRVLVLPGSDLMTPTLLGKIKDLVAAGATVIGAPPSRSPSLGGYPVCDDHVRQLAAELWGDCDGQKIKERRFGKGRIVRGVEPEKWLAAAGVAPDFTSQRRLRFLHRALPGTDIYFVANTKLVPMATSAAFRVAGRIPELWWPETGRIERAPVYEAGKGMTRVMLPLGPSGSVFVVFREPVKDADPLVSVTRDGRVLFGTADDPAFKVRIEKAVYGVLDDPQRTRDMTAKVQSLVDAGEDRIFVNIMAEKEDPAVNVVKTLLVDYTLNGRRFTVRGRDGQYLRFPETAVQVTVEKATYGIPGDAQRTRDVRDKLQRLFDAGENEFPVARMAEGDDPAFMQVKTLTFEYTINGLHRVFKGTDGDPIDLAPPDLIESSAELTTDREGRIHLVARQPGQYAFRTASGKTWSMTAPELPAALELSRDWSVAFDPAWGGPASVVMDRLIPLNEHSDPGVKHYSGTATYRKAFAVPKTMLDEHRRLILDLGRVEVMAEVAVNGKPLGLLWKPPYRVDATDALKAGRNELQVKVVNLWPNRMIGDEALPEDSERNPNGTLKVWPQWLLDGKPSPTGRLTFTSWRLWRKDDALLPSGLLGPAELLVWHTMKIGP